MIIEVCGTVCNMTYAKIHFFMDYCWLRPIISMDSYFVITFYDNELHLEGSFLYIYSHFFINELIEYNDVTN